LSKISNKKDENNSKIERETNIIKKINLSRIWDDKKYLFQDGSHIQ
jgi:hypothetical protein